MVGVDDAVGIVEVVGAGVGLVVEVGFVVGVAVGVEVNGVPV